MSSLVACRRTRKTPKRSRIPWTERKFALPQSKFAAQISKFAVYFRKFAPPQRKLAA